MPHLNISTNIIESPHSGVHSRTRSVTNWQDGKMVLRWATAGFAETHKHFKRIGGYKQLWMLKSYLDELETDKALAEKEVQDKVNEMEPSPTFNYSWYVIDNRAVINLLIAGENVHLQNTVV